MFMNREISKLIDYKPTIGDKISFIQYEKEIPIEGSNNIFKYPEEVSIYNAADAQKRVSRFNLSR